MTNGKYNKNEKMCTVINIKQMFFITELYYEKPFLI